MMKLLYEDLKEFIGVGYMGFFLIAFFSLLAYISLNWEQDGNIAFAIGIFFIIVVLLCVVRVIHLKRMNTRKSKREDFIKKYSVAMKLFRLSLQDCRDTFKWKDRGNDDNSPPKSLGDTYEKFTEIERGVNEL